MPLTPPPLPQNRRRKFPWYIKCLIALGLVPGLVCGALIGLRLLGLFCPYYVPSRSMAPAISAGDHIVMEGLMFLLILGLARDVISICFSQTAG